MCQFVFSGVGDLVAFLSDLIKKYPIDYKLLYVTKELKREGCFNSDENL
jgi:hypothetical protein